MSQGPSRACVPASGRSASRPRSTSLVDLEARAARLRGLEDEAGLERLERGLRADPRSGARRIGAACRGWLADVRHERERMARIFRLRADLLRAGARAIAGVDEVGVGPLAGPVVAAAVILPVDVELPGLDDSKRLKRDQRETLDRAIRAQADGYAIGEVWPSEIDRLNIYHAALEAMRRAVVALDRRVRPDHLLVDARTIPRVRQRQTAIVHGDAEDGSIAAASIVAKVHRDAIMQGLDAELPGYGFASHMGYPTPRHVEALHRLGASHVHRRSFGPVAAVVRS